MIGLPIFEISPEMAAFMENGEAVKLDPSNLEIIYFINIDNIRKDGETTIVTSSGVEYNCPWSIDKLKIIILDWILPEEDIIPKKKKKKKKD
tara:strand:+ start:1776 stop:2051 length:276 start_codon:yes stop_codon:yes gene_type:complete